MPPASVGPDELLALAEEHGIEITRPIEDALTETGDAGYLTIARFSGDGDGSSTPTGATRT